MIKLSKQKKYLLRSSKQVITNLFLTLVIGLFSVGVSGQNLSRFIKTENLTQKYAKYNTVIGFDSISAKVQESGLSLVSRKTLYVANNDNGATELATIILDYEPMSADITINKTVIIRANGKEEALFSKDKVYDYAAPARMIYWGARQKMIEPGKLFSGDAVYIEYERKGYTYALLQSDDEERFIPPMRGHYYDIIEFFDRVPIHKKYFRVEMPNTKELIYKTYNGKFKENIYEKGDSKIAEFELTNIIPIKREYARVADVDIAPKVIVTTTKAWEEKSKWFYGVNEDYGSFKSNPDIDKKVAEILKDANDELDSIGRLNRWVADEIRYSGISMGTGEGFTLHSGAMNYTDRCGVCKDKAGMLVTMLRAAGFESYAAMTMAGSRIENIPADQFNHSVTVVKLRNGKFQLLDPTWIPFIREMWSSREQQQNYLLGLPEGDIMRETPISEPENHWLKIDNNATLNSEGTLEGTITVSAEGQSDATVRSIFTRSYTEQWEWNVRNQIISYYPTAQIDSVYYSEPYKYYEAPVSILIRYKIPNFAPTNGSTMIVNTMTSNGVFGYTQIYGRWNTNLKEREFDFAGSCSQLVEITENITVPENAQLMSNKNRIVSEKGEFVSIDTNISLKNNVLQTKITERFEQRKYPSEAWKEFVTLLKAREDFQKPIVVKF
ncbi:MAG: DUF3857 and transglutaminase domain-containing protein [Salinivirgaceae bacterium]|nr:DUF3857 and transglutaminase domain-containing protein [Salinivirgaceae bacterium]